MIVMKMHYQLLRTHSHSLESQQIRICRTLRVNSVAIIVHVDRLVH